MSKQRPAQRSAPPPVAPPRSKPQTPSPSAALTIHVTDDEDLTTFLVNLLDGGYLMWLAVEGRLPRLGRDHAIPLHLSMSWQDCRRRIMPAVRQFWEMYTEANEPRLNPRNTKDHCFDIIARVLGTLPDPWTPRSPTFPLWKGRALTAYRLVKLMEEENDSLDAGTYQKYARLWLLSRRFVQSEPRFSPHDLAFLKRIDRQAYATAKALQRPQDLVKYLD